MVTNQLNQQTKQEPSFTYRTSPKENIKPNPHKIELPKKYTISFEGTSIEPITAYAGDLIIKPSDPVMMGYKFLGWDKEVPTNMPNFNLIIKANWEKQSFDAIFKINEVECGRVNILFGGIINIPEECSKEEPGYIYSPWTPEVGVMDEEGKTFK